MLVSAAGTPVSGEWRVVAVKTTHLQVVCLCEGSRHDEAPTDRASLWLLHGARRRPTQGACSSLPLALQAWRVVAATTTHLFVVCLCDGSRHDEAQINLQLCYNLSITCECVIDPYRRTMSTVKFTDALKTTKHGVEGCSKHTPNYYTKH